MQRFHSDKIPVLVFLSSLITMFKGKPRCWKTCLTHCILEVIHCTILSLVPGYSLTREQRVNVNFDTILSLSGYTEDRARNEGRKAYTRQKEFVGSLRAERSMKVIKAKMKYTVLVPRSNSSFLGTGITWHSFIFINSMAV